MENGSSQDRGDLADAISSRNQTFKYGLFCCSGGVALVLYGLYELGGYRHRSLLSGCILVVIGIILLFSAFAFAMQAMVIKKKFERKP